MTKDEKRIEYLENKVDKGTCSKVLRAELNVLIDLHSSKFIPLASVRQINKICD